MSIIKSKVNKNSIFYNLLILTKPGIIIGNIINVFAGFFLSSKIYSHQFNLFDLSIVIISIILIIASGCVFNNIYDRDIDKLMTRTKKRSLIFEQISIKFAFFYAVILGILGFYILYYFGNFFSFFAAIIGFLFYTIIYTIFLKRNSIYDIHIGSISGSMPPLIAYFFISNQIDFEAIMLFIIFSLWQIPHSLAITLYRQNDYQKANITISPFKKGVKQTQKDILFWIILFFIAAIILFKSNFVGLIYLIAIMAFSLYWIFCYFRSDSNLEQWAKKILFLSIWVIFAFDISLMVNYLV
ncbi:heme o synthase [Rickettsiales bacterium]|nr:heme o synthase [Rickettsiales bacterium]MDB2550247.1 heme o synthase [Rickettsiales bacterium]